MVLKPIVNDGILTISTGDRRISELSTVTMLLRSFWRSNFPHENFDKINLSGSKFIETKQLWMILLMAEILHQFIDFIGSLSHYLYGFIPPRWCKISAINSRKWLWMIPSRGLPGKRENHRLESADWYGDSYGTVPRRVFHRLSSESERSQTHGEFLLWSCIKTSAIFLRFALHTEKVEPLVNDRQNIGCRLFLKN